MKFYKISIDITDAVAAKNYNEAMDKFIYDIAPNIGDLSDFTSITECSEDDYKYNTRG